MGRIDIIYGTVAAALAAVFFFSSFRFPVREGAVNPRAFPWFVIFGMFALSVSLIVKGFMRLAADRTGRKLQEVSDRKAGSPADDSPEAGSAALDGAHLETPHFGETAVEASAETPRGRRTVTWSPSVRFAALAAAGALYVFVIELVGYLVSTPFLIAFSVFTFGERRPVRIALVSIVTTAVLYYLFRMVFRVPLPRWGL
jgi:hypothetical protein